MKNLILIVFISLASMAIIGCSKGNPKNTDLIGDKYRQMIVGKWRVVHDSSIYSYGGVISTDTSGVANDYTTYAADGTFINSVVNVTGTYVITKDSLTLKTPPLSAGGFTLPATNYPYSIKLINAIDLVVESHKTQDVIVNGVNLGSRLYQKTFFKKQ